MKWSEWMGGSWYGWITEVAAVVIGSDEAEAIAFIE